MSKLTIVFLGEKIHLWLKITKPNTLSKNTDKGVKQSKVEK